MKKPMKTKMKTTRPMSKKNAPKMTKGKCKSMKKGRGY